MIQKIYRYIFWIGYAAVFYSSLIKIPGSLNETKIGVEGFNIRLDHLLHLAVYFLIVIYFMAGQRKGPVLFRKNALLKFIIVILLLATVTEVVQLWVPARAFNPLDWLSNVAGVILGLGVVCVVKQGWKR
jgi:VanZ family protein